MYIIDIYWVILWGLWLDNIESSKIIGIMIGINNG